MKTLIPFLCMMCLSLSAAASDVPGIPPPNDPKLLPSLIQKSEGTYTKVNDQLYSVTYRGKQMTTMNVRIMASEGAIIFMVSIIERSKLALSKNFLLRLAEMNLEWDYAKIGLDKDSLAVRIDARAAGITQSEFEFLENQVVQVADGVYGEIKDFLP